MRDGVCTRRRSTDPVWATQLRYLEQRIVERAATVLRARCRAAVDTVGRDGPAPRERPERLRSAPVLVHWEDRKHPL